MHPFSVKESLLPAEQQRKYDYFFLEAMRMKEKNEYDAAFGFVTALSGYQSERFFGTL